MQKHPRVFCVIALNDDTHNTKILHGDETCSLPGNCCLHMLQIRKCTWQRKCCGEALKTQDLGGSVTQPRRIVSSLLLISHCVFPKLSSFVTSLPQLPSLSISDCKYTWMWLRWGKGKKRWDEITAAYGYSRETPLNSKNSGGRKRENYSSTSRHHYGVLSSASSSLLRHLLLSLHGKVGAAHSDVRTAPSAFCCNSQRERNEKKARRSETERGGG